MPDLRCASQFAGSRFAGVEPAVSDELPGRLSAILTDVHQTISDAEAGITSSARQLGVLLDSLEQERTSVLAEIEQIQLDRIVHNRSDDAEDEHSAYESELRQRQHELTAAVGRVSSLQQRVVDFDHLMAAALQQFTADEQLPGVDDAVELNQRQAMIRAKEEERARLSREIHDGPAQVLANAIIGLEFIERSLRLSEATADAPAVSEVERIKGSMRDGLSEIRRFIFDLRPTMLAQRGLIGTVEHYINTYRTFLPDEIELQLPPAPPGLNPDQELAAFRVIQESLQNVHRHADATRCVISIESNEHGLTVEVRDNGRGFDPSGVRIGSRGGSGIIGMRERAEVIGARLSVDSRSGEGCTVTLRIPSSSRAREQSRDGVVDQRHFH
jgi:two-component system, NarL family, sensor histidine kinase DegS